MKRITTPGHHVHDVWLRVKYAPLSKYPPLSKYAPLWVCAAILMVIPFFARAQGSAGTDAKIESRHVIDLPVAGLVPAGTLCLDADFFQEGGFLTAFSVGVLDRFILGISYGGTNVVGNGNPNWNPLPGFQLRARVLDESSTFPAIALGFDSQGKDPYVESASRYTIKSPGVYLVGSKNYQVMGFLAVHAGLNYSFEHADGDKDINAFAGVEKTLGPFLSILGEYNLASNDNTGDALGIGRGYLNLGAKISVGNGFSLSFAFKDLLHNQPEGTAGNRVIQLEYVHL